MARESKKFVGSSQGSKKSRLPITSSRRSVRLNKRAMNDLRGNVKQCLDMNLSSSAGKAAFNEVRKGEKIKKRRKKENLVTIIDENILNEDFIPLSFSEPSKKSEELKFCEAVVDETEPPTIIIEDDENDADVTTSESVVNDSIQIIGVNQQSKPEKRKLNESIEICYEAFDTRNHAAKKPNVTPSCSKDVILKPFYVIQEDQEASSSEKNKNAESDDEIVVIESDIDSENITVLKDIPQQNNSSHCGKKRERKKKLERTNGTKLALCKPTQSLVFEDSQGTSNNKSATYKSPLTSSSDMSYFNETGNNIYNPNNNDKKTGLRPVIIDGCNVAYGHGGNVFSTRGVEICVNYFVKRGHMVRVFVPRYRRNEVPDSDREILDEMQRKQQLSFTPSRYLHGRCVASYDDRFIVQCAAELGGVIVSTDNYRDLVGENESWRDTIEKRLLMFTWVNDILMFPDDPLGRNGPRLEEFLKFPE